MKKQTKQKPINNSKELPNKTVQKQDFDNFLKSMIKTDKLTNKDLKKKK